MDGARDQPATAWHRSRRLWLLLGTLAALTTADVLTPSSPRHLAPVAAAPVRPEIPLAQAFPTAVAGGYTRVSASRAATCTDAHVVGLALADLITQGHPCLGLQTALYQDAAKDRFTLAVFTLHDQMAAFTLTTALSAAPTDDEITPAASTGTGLGLVQDFASASRATLVGVAQWPDGRAKDYPQLRARLTPLLTAVTGNVTAYESLH